MSEPARGDARAILALTGATLALLALYLAGTVISGELLPTGPDAALYAWWTDLARAEGLEIVPGRGGTLAFTTFLDLVVPGDPIAAVAVAGPMLALVVALAAGGFAMAAKGGGVRTGLATALLSGAWAAALAPSWLASLASVACGLVGFALLCTASGSWQRVLVGGVCMAASGAAHLGILPLLAAIAVVGAALLAWKAPEARPTAVGIALGSLGGAGLGVLAALGSDARLLPGDTSQDAFLRRTGLRSILADRFRERLAADGRRAALPAIAGLALGWNRGSRRTEDSAGSGDDRAYAALCTAWAVLTLAGVVVLAILPRAQGNRLVALAFFVPLMAGPGFARLTSAGGRSSWAAWIAAGVLVAGGMYGWHRQPTYMGPHELRLAATLGEASERLSSGTPLVLLTDTREEAPGFHVTRAGNVVRTGLRAARQRSFYVAVGSPADHLAGRSTGTGDVEHDTLSQRYGEAIPDGPTAIAVLRPFNRSGFRQAGLIGSPVAPGIVSIGDVRIPPTDLAPAGAGIPPAVRAAWTIGGVGLLALLGWGWAAWALPVRSRLASFALAPGVGLVVVAVTGTVADRLLTGPGVFYAAGLGAVGWAAAGLTHR